MTDDSSPRRFGQVAGPCIWPKCPEYEHAAPLKLCKAHAAIVAYNATKYIAVDMTVRDMHLADRDAAWNARQAQRQAEKEAAGPTPGTLYALLSGYNVKIGWTSRDVTARLREYPPSCTVLVAYPATRAEETRLKRRFKHLRTHGNEWLPYAPQVTEWVDQMVAEHGAPDPDLTCGPAKYQVPRPHALKSTPRPKHTAWHVS